MRSQFTHSGSTSGDSPPKQPEVPPQESFPTKPVPVSDEAAHEMDVNLRDESPGRKAKVSGRRFLFSSLNRMVLPVFVSALGALLAIDRLFRPDGSSRVGEHQ